MESLEEVLCSYTAGLGAFEQQLQRIRGALRDMAEETAAAAAAAAAAASPPSARTTLSTETPTTAAAATAARPAGGVAAELAPLEAAQLNVATAFAACTLWFCKGLGFRV